MASIRRTQSPYHDRSHQNGCGSPFSAHSQLNKLPSSGKCSSLASASASASAVGVRRFFDEVFFFQYSRRTQQTWRKSFYRFSLLFALGFMLGMMPFGGVDDVRSHDFSFEMKWPPVNIQENVADGVGASQAEKLVVNSVELGVERRFKMKERFDFVHRNELIVVTPTYNRAFQAYFLNRLGQLLRLVPPPLLWIVVEMNTASGETAEILRKTGVTYRHLVCTKNSTDVKDRGVYQRNAALEHIEHHKLDGIIYFADDDNIYSLDLFEILREIRRFGTWPVAMLAQSKNKAILEGPVCNDSKVIGWHTNEKSKRLRRFHVDMSGFAFNSTILWDPKQWRRPASNPIRQLDTVKEGFQETTFIEQVVEDEYQMEGSRPSCSRIMNWHLHLEAARSVYPRGWLLQKNLDVILPVT